MTVVRKPGDAVAGLLKGAWRDTPPPEKISEEEFEIAAPLLLISGAGALGWSRIRQQSSLHGMSSAQLLRNAYLASAVELIEHERKIATVASELAREQILFILLKGRAAARFYSEPSLRPTGDIDLYFPRELMRRVRPIFDEPPYSGYHVDLEHTQFARFDDRCFEQFYTQTKSIWLGDIELRVLGEEDHLRFLCLHFLKHGGWRPIWLCDIAAVLEQVAPDFDWDRCLGLNEVHANWILCTIGLAQNILQARLQHPPPPSRRISPPAWLVNHILDRWGNPVLPHLPTFEEQIRQEWRQPIKLIDAMLNRWPDPIQATLHAGRPFNEHPRWPSQLRTFRSRAARLGCMKVLETLSSVRRITDGKI